MYGIFSLDDDKRYVEPHYSNLNSTINITKKKTYLSDDSVPVSEGKSVHRSCQQIYCARKAAR